MTEFSMHDRRLAERFLTLAWTGMAAQVVSLKTACVASLPSDWLRCGATVLSPPARLTASQTLFVHPLMDMTCSCSSSAVPL